MQRPFVGRIDRIDDCVHLPMPAREGRMRILKVAQVGPGFARPRVLLGHRNEIYVAASGNEVVNEVSTGPKPSCAQSFQIEVTQTLGGCKPAIGNVTREAGLLRPEQHRTHGTANAVSADNEVSRDARAILEMRGGIVHLLGDTGATLACVHAVSGQSCDQNRKQIGPMKVKVGCAEHAYDRLAHGHARQHAAVLPTSALNGDGLHPAFLEWRLEPVAVQQPGRVRADLDPGTDLFLLRRLLVDLHIHACPQEGNGRCHSTDTPADDRGRHAVGHVAASDPVARASTPSGGSFDGSAPPLQAMC